MICWSGWASNNAKLLRRRAMNIPNSLTVSRLLAIPVLMALLLLRFPGHDQVAAGLFVLFSLTDTLDGELARRRGTVSDFGKFLDPLADKLFVLSVLIVLVQEGLVAAWVVVVIFSRELLITILRSVAATQGRVIAAAPMGKTKTATQMAAVALLILQRPYPVLCPLAELAVAIAILFTVASGVDYAGEAKRAQLGVPAALLPRHGAVSREVALVLAEGVRTRLGTTLAASITGIAGPDAEGSKPVGLTYIAIATPRGTTCDEYMFSGDRWSNRRQAAGQALRLLIEAARAGEGKLAS